MYLYIYFQEVTYKFVKLINQTRHRFPHKLNAIKYLEHDNTGKV